MFDEEIQKETSRTLQYRIIGFQEIFIRSEQVVLPQMLGQPCTSARPHTSRRKIHHAADTPKVGVMVSHPAPATIHFTRRFRSCHGQVFQHGEQRLVHLTQVSHFGQPVVHLGIDIDGIFAVPRGIRTAIPDALQIGRLSTGL